MEVQLPRVREAEEDFESALLNRLGSIEQRLKTLAVEMYTRGLSTRDVEATLTGPDGEPEVSRSGASRMSEALYEEYERWAGQGTCPGSMWFTCSGMGSMNRSDRLAAAK